MYCPLSHVVQFIGISSEYTALLNVERKIKKTIFLKFIGAHVSLRTIELIYLVFILDSLAYFAGEVTFIAIIIIGNNAEIVGGAAGEVL